MAYEYTVEDIGSHVSAEWLADKLNQLSPNGWELLTATTVPGGNLRLIYRREVGRAAVHDAIVE
jgi:hypothetical protein